MQRYWSKYDYSLAGFGMAVGVMVLIRGDFWGLGIIAIALFPYFWPRS